MNAARLYPKLGAAPRNNLNPTWNIPFSSANWLICEQAPRQNESNEF
jgi:hypothetical protein